jgi:hypothetical protein
MKNKTSNGSLLLAGMPKPPRLRLVDFYHLHRGGAKADTIQPRSSQNGPSEPGSRGPGCAFRPQYENTSGAFRVGNGAASETVNVSWWICFVALE